MANSVRTQTDLAAHHMKALDKLATRRGVPRSVLIREAVYRLLQQECPQELEKGEKK